MSRLRKYRDLSKGISLNEGDFVVIGLDVHKRSHHMAVLLNGEIVKTAVVPSSSELVARLTWAMQTNRRGEKSFALADQP